MDRLNQSLDDIISTRNKEKKSSRRQGGKKEGGRGGGAMKSRGNRKQRNVDAAPYDAEAPIRKPHLVQPSGQREAPQKQPITARLGNKGSVMSRLGSQGAQHASGTKVDFGNLNFDITAADIEELCLSVGEVRSVSIVYDRSGRSTGHANAIFARRSDALAAIQKFNGLALDGAAMEVKLAGEGGRENPFNPQPSGGAPRSNKQQLRGGLFGSALQGDGEEEIVYPGRDHRPRSGSNPSFTVTFGEEKRNNKPRRGPKGGGGRGRGNRQRNRDTPKSQEELDAEMESYMAQRGGEEE